MLWMKYSLNPGTLRNIEKEFRAPIKKFQLEKSNTSRNLVESPKICDAIWAFLSSHRIPWTANDMWSCLKSKLGIKVSSRIVREVWKRILGMKYKKGLSRIVSFDEEMNRLTKQWFTIRILKSLDQFNVLINIDESSFSRLTKKNYSWIPKGKEQIIKNISFYNLWSLIAAITSTGCVVVAKSDKLVTSKHFIGFLEKLLEFIRVREGVDIQRCLIILDNASVHRAKMTQQYMKTNGLNVAFIPQYSPELAPIEHYFSKLKQSVTEMAKGKRINWKFSTQTLFWQSEWRIFRHEWWKGFGHLL